MSTLRKRNTKGSLESDSITSSTLSKRSSKGERIDRTFTSIILVIFGTIFSFMLILQFWPKMLPSQVHSFMDATLNYIGVDQTLYVVVIDAGSTGSRVLGFTFHKNLLTGQLHLDDELWVQVKPGLSSYAQEPKRAADSIVELLSHAKTRVPEFKRPTTTVELKATAGLRLLPEAESEAILREVRMVLETSGFKTDENLIEIMNPMEEGLFAWFTVNFLKDRLSRLDESIACLDLGGGSTQITFAHQIPVSGLENRKHFLHRVSILKQEIDVYSHSYLGLGLMAVRMAVLNNGSHPCMGRNNVPVEWSYHGEFFVVQGVNSSSPYQDCVQVVKQVIDNVDVHVPSELKTREIAAFSYFYDRALDRKIKDGKIENIIIQDIIDHAKISCDDEVDLHKFHCLDLTFISLLLTEGYGLPPSKTIHLYDKIDGHEVSWALGAAFNILDKS